MTALRTIETLHGPAGRLEALLDEGSPAAQYAVVVAHPHPLFGGTMHNKVVYQTMKAFRAYGLPVLRFNFRGAGLSEGKHDFGNGEVDDLRAALDWMHQQYKLPLLFAGFSFGSYIGLKACCDDARVMGLVVLGLPVRAGNRAYTYEFFTGCSQPKLFISGAEDEFAPLAEVEWVVASAPSPAELVVVPEADHFFFGKLDQVAHALGIWLEEQFGLHAP